MNKWIFNLSLSKANSKHLEFFPLFPMYTVAGGGGRELYFFSTTDRTSTTVTVTA